MNSVKFPWLKIYLGLLIILSLALIGYNLFAATVETPVKQYVKVGDCPSFITTDTANFNDLTMKDTCTGLLWARYELPTYHGAAEPGYTWDEANDGCANLAPAGMFRLPTVEELLSLLKYQCQGTNCTPSLPVEILTKSNTTDTSNVKPFFSNGTYWSQTNFNQPASYTNVNAIPPGNAARDYKRSVNLNNGQVDSPAYSKQMKLNAWCVIDKNPDVVEAKFISAIESGNSVTGGSLQTVYNRKCTSDFDCEALSGTICNVGFCTKTENKVLANSRLVKCADNQHIKNDSCVNNPNNAVAGVCPPPLSPTTDARQVWKGNIFNGYDVCILNTCSDSANFHINSDTYLCDSNEKPCDLPADTQNLNWVSQAVNTWTGADFGACHAKICSYNAQPAGSPATCQCGVTAGSTVSPEGVCTTCGAGNHYEPLSAYTSLSDCTSHSGTWTGSACVTCKADIGDDCSHHFCVKGNDLSTRACDTDPAVCDNGYTCTQIDSRTFDWSGSLLSGSSQCTFHGCASGYHEEIVGSQVCIPDTRPCTLTSAEDPYALTLTASQSWVSANSDWGTCQAQTCNSSASLVNGICTCPAPKIIRDWGGSWVCSSCGNGSINGSCSNSVYTTQTTCAANGATWTADLTGEQCESGSSSRGFGVCTYDNPPFGKVATCSLIPTGLMPPKTVQAVFVVDTSGSIAGPMANLCAVRKEVQTALTTSGYNTTIDIYGISDSYTLGNIAGNAAGACATGLYTGVNDTANNVVKNIYWQYPYSETGPCNYIWPATNCTNNTTSGSCPVNNGCKWDGSSCLPNYEYCTVATTSAVCSSKGTNKCVWEQCGNVALGECDSYNETDCASHAYCQWNVANGCSRNFNYCWGGKSSSACKTLNPSCQYTDQENNVYGCGNGYVYSNNTYGTTYPKRCKSNTGFTATSCTTNANCLTGEVCTDYALANPVKLQASTSMCLEDWVSSAITTIQKLSNPSNPVQWTSDSDRELILLFDESPYNGYGGAGESWLSNDYQHMQNSLRTTTLGLSLITEANANNVKISLIFARALTPTDLSCTGWTWATSQATPNTDQNKYCAFKKIADSTGGTVQYGASIMSTPATTASVITTAIQLSAADKFCNGTKVCSNNGQLCATDADCGSGNTCAYTGLLDCKWR